MSEAKKSVMTAVAVVIGAGLLIVGNTMRDRIDLGTVQPRAGSLPMEGLVASREQTPDVPEGAFFREMVQLLKREYVDPITDESKMATGAVRGMVQSLEDGESLFLDAEEFAAHTDALNGTYQGAGIDVVLKLEAVDETQGEAPKWVLPRLIVGGVAPGGAADKAGVKVGDWVQGVDGHWVANALEIKKFRSQQKQLTDGKMTEPQFRDIQKAMRAKTERSLNALKARKKLTVGTKGTLKVVWNRDGKLIDTTLALATVKVTSHEINGDVLNLRFQPKVADSLDEALKGRQALTIDLRGRSGDYASMRECLEKLAKAGTYGTVSGGPVREAELLKVAKGNPSPPKLKLLVDAGTRGAAEIFAMALASKGATLVGGKMAGAPFVIETIALPAGGGYTLVTGEYVRELVKEAKTS